MKQNNIKIPVIQVTVILCLLISSSKHITVSQRVDMAATAQPGITVPTLHAKINSRRTIQNSFWASHSHDLSNDSSHIWVS